MAVWGEGYGCSTFRGTPSACRDDIGRFGKLFSFKGFVILIRSIVGYGTEMGELNARLCHNGSQLKDPYAILEVCAHLLAQR